MVSRPSSMFAVVDLPEPDSPTSETVLPARMSNETSSTARNGPEERPRSAYSLTTFRTETRGTACSEIRSRAAVRTGARPSDSPGTAAMSNFV
jgi:hypothetical protein